MKKIQLFKDIRINSGKYRGSRLYRANASITRPALNRSRTGIFNLLHSKFENGFNLILDCFAGSGAIAIEAISRRIAKNAIMCDLSADAITALNKNIQILDEIDKNACSVIAGNILELIINYTKADLIFIDPPYKDTENLSNILLKQISELDFKIGAIIIVENDFKTPKRIILPNNISLFDRRRYGRNEFLFCQKN